MLKWADLPQKERDRLKKNEQANRHRARENGLPVVPVSVEALWLLQKGKCSCPVCDYKKDLIIGDTVIAHRKHLRSRTGSPGHVPHNVELWRKDCNAKEAKQEKHDLHKFDRFNLTVPTTVEKREKPKSRSRWPKGRKIKSRGFK